MTAKPSVIDFPTLAERLLADAPALLRQWLPAGKIRGREFTVGNIKGDIGDSLCINIDSGKWHDFSTGDKGGDLISLYAAIHNIKQSEAAKQLGGGTTIQDDVFITGQICHPLPKHKHGKPTAIYEYKNAQGELYGYVCRFDPLNENKQFSPLTCWKNADGKLKWQWKKWPIDSLPYRIEHAVGNPATKILICEGEKAADAAQKLLPQDWIALGWCGGAEAIKRTDWKLLQTRHCWIWPDNDEPGYKAAQALKRILQDLHIVQLPEGLPIGFDLADADTGFNVIQHLQPKSKPVQQITLEERETASRDIKQQAEIEFPHIVKDKPLATIENLRTLFTMKNIRCRYNVISKRILFDIPGQTYSVENGDEVALALIYSYIKQIEMPVDGYKAYTLRIADENQYNPALEMIRYKPWDKIDRLQAFYNTIQSPETEAKELILRRWLITAVYMALKEGIDSAGCLVLQGPQDLGKTWWVKKLVPEAIRKELVRTDASVDPKDRDSVSQVISYWIVELGEIEATFNRAELQGIKTFISRDFDTMRRPYGEGDKRYPRRTALVASVDQHVFLRDTAGNRRFWTIPCTSINSYHEIDMQQLWAQVLWLIEEQGESWQLQPDEKAHIARINQEHMQIEPIIELLRDLYNPESPAITQSWKTSSQIAKTLELKNVTQRETRIIASYLRDVKCPSRKSNGNVQFLV